jgi:hypothetical protein
MISKEPPNEPSRFDDLLGLLEKLPAINLPAGRRSIGRGGAEDGTWWVKFSLETGHELAWRHVQELGFVLNYLSIQERLPTRFYPVSPPPYLNGGEEFLMWIIQSTDPTFSPTKCAEWLQGRLPQPVEDPSKWRMN